MKDINVLTWLDVDFILESYRAEKQLPTWLSGYTVYQNELEIEVTQGTTLTDIDTFFKEVFGVRYNPPKTIALDSSPEKLRKLRIFVEEIDKAPRLPFKNADIPSFRRVAAFPEDHSTFGLPSAFPDDSPQVIAFYSFKGGVGRTTHLLAYLKALSQAKENRSVLVIDADLEAPGITSLIQHESSVPPANLSFIDLLALCQSDLTPEWNDSLQLAAYLTRRQILPTSDANSVHYFIPSFRTEEQAMRLDIKPEHLTNRPGYAWALTTFLSKLGKALSVDVILIDLRAGYSELASPFLFDPRIKKVLLTTPSIQSVDGTASVMQQLGKIARVAADENSPEPTLVLSFVLPELINSDYILNKITRLQQSYPDIYRDENRVNLQTIVTPFSQELVYFDSFVQAMTKLEASALVREMEELVEFDLPTIAPEITQDRPPLDELRRSLMNYAEKLEYAESGKGENFLRIAPLKALARQYSAVPPIAVVIGAKGAGKTYTYLQILRAGDWSEFVRRVNGTEVQQTMTLWPALHSLNLDTPAENLITTSRSKVAQAIGTSPANSSIDISDLIRDALRRKDTDETWWRHKWFEIFSASLGISKSETSSDAAANIIEHLRALGQNLVLMIDGLEDLLPELATSSTEQLALRALVQGVPSYLRAIPDSPLGILVFVRADLARAAVPQNYGQFSRLYEPFALQWGVEEALRLAVWLTDSAGIKRPDGLAGAPETLSAHETKEVLLPVWGRKLGTEKSRETRTAEWVIAALSDFKGQIQARDLVRFFRFAAQASVDSPIRDRVLIPSAIRSAIKPCSKSKVDEAEQEIPQLQSIFLKFQRRSDLRIPFIAQDADLSSEDMRFLQSVGIVAERDGKFYMPEIFRLGLDLKLVEGARPNVMSFAPRLV